MSSTKTVLKTSKQTQVLDLACTTVAKDAHVNSPMATVQSASKTWMGRTRLYTVKVSVCNGS